MSLFCPFSFYHFTSAVTTAPFDIFHGHSMDIKPLDDTPHTCTFLISVSLISSSTRHRFPLYYAECRVQIDTLCYSVLG
jgi:hypothetical protein